MNLVIVQPFLTKYRLPVYLQLAEQFNVILLSSESTSYGQLNREELGRLCWHKLPYHELFSGRLIFQSGLIRHCSAFKPDAILLYANPRSLSNWLLLLWAKARGIKVLLHGQGLYRKPSISLGSRVIFGLFNKLCARYLCYTDFSKESLKELAIHSKASVLDNVILNDFPVEKTSDRAELLFIGRLREGCGVELLLESVLALNEKEPRVKVHLIGGGELLQHYQDKYAEALEIHFHGEIYDTQKVSQIANSCSLGVYPGDAGLSIFHYMSLSLPPVIHGELHQHMGPEPSYVQDGVNGVLFKKGDRADLARVIKQTLAKPELLAELQQGAYQTYLAKTKVSMAEKFSKAIKEVVTGEGT